MRRSLTALAALALLACGGDKPETKVPELKDVLPTIVLPRLTTLVSWSGSEDAIALLYRSATETSEVENFYRLMLSKQPWQLVSEAKDNEGSTVFHATQDGPPLWVAVWHDSTLNATMIRMSGAVRKLGAPGMPGQGKAPTP